MEENSYQTLLENVIEFYNNGKIYEAIQILEVSTDLYKNDDIYFKLGFLYSQTKDLNRTAQNYKLAIEFNSTKYEYFYNLGIVLNSLDQKKEAIECFEKVIELNSTFYMAYYNLACVQKHTGAINEAEKNFNKTLAIKNSYVPALYNLGVIEQEKHNLDAALNYYNQVLQIDSEHVDSHWNSAIILLTKGDYPNGFREYSWRWKTKEFETKQIPNKTIINSYLDIKTNSTVLISDEQGFGDTIQFVRFIPILRAKYNAYIVFECKPELYSLLKTFEGIDQLHKRNTYQGKFDYHFSLLDIPLLLSINKDNIPNSIPYFNFNLLPKIDIDCINNCTKIKIGLSLQGNPNHQNDTKRSIAFDSAKSIFSNDKIQYFNVNKAQISENYRIKYNIIDLSSYIDDFSKTASILLRLDFVLTVDTSIAHLAGALGVKTILLLPYNNDWRWFENIDYSPYYPTIKIFRLKKEEQWDEFFEHSLCYYLEQIVAMPTINAYNPENDTKDNKAYTTIITPSTEIKKPKNIITHIEQMENEDYTALSNPKPEFIENRSSGCIESVQNSTDEVENILAQASIFFSQNNYNKVIEILEPEINSHPNNFYLLYNLGLALVRTDEIHKALNILEKAYAIDCKNYDLLKTLIIVYIQNNNLDKAKQISKEFFDLYSNQFDAIFSRGNVLLAFKEYDKALELYCKAARMCTTPEILNNMGSCYFGIEDFTNAADCWLKALEINSTYADVYYNLGKLFEETRTYDKALECYTTAVSLKDNFFDAEFALSEMLLMKQNFEEGFKKYEVRKLLRDYKINPIDGCEWNDEDITNKTILVYDEQGNGDVIQFTRYLQALKNRARKVIFVCRDTLFRLFSNTNLCDIVINYNSVIPEFDYKVSLLSLPYKLGKYTIENHSRYIKIDPQPFNKFYELIGNEEAVKIGICTEASSNIKSKSIDLNYLSFLDNIPNSKIYLFNFNKAENTFNHFIDISNEITDFADTAAALENLDLIITVDTALAHLAGSINKRTILLLKYNADWRWFENIDYSPYYPSMTIIRQTEYNSWQTVVEKLKDLVEKELNQWYVEVHHYSIFTSAITGNNIEEATKIYNQYSTIWDNSLTKQQACGIYKYLTRDYLGAIQCIEKHSEYFGENFVQQYILSSVFAEMEENYKALEILNKLISSNPTNAVLHCDKGDVLVKLRQNEEAIQAYQFCIKLNPELLPAYNNLANLYREFGDYDLSKNTYLLALDKFPDSLDLIYNYASLLQFLKENNEAINLYKKIIRLDYHFYQAHFNLSTLLLSIGNFDEGFEEYKFRKYIPSVGIKTLNVPEWDGEALNGKTLYIFDEQGVGDTINFIRFVKYIKNDYPDSTLIFNTKESLKKLLENLDFIDIIHTNCDNDITQNISYYSNLFSIVSLYKNKIYNCIEDVDIFHSINWGMHEFLHSDKENQIKIGIVWKGNSNHKFDKFRSLKLDNFSFLAKLPNTIVYSFQKEATSEEKHMLSELGYIDLSEKLNDYFDTASLLSNIDYLITVDTSVAHLSATIGNADIFMFIPFYCDWRWLQTGEKTLWYNRVKLFRENNLKSREQTIELLKQELERKIIKS